MKGVYEKQVFIDAFEFGDIDALVEKVKEIDPGFASKTVCFSGNRPAHLPWKTNEDCDIYEEFKSSFIKLIDKLIDAGYRHFISGMALGFDLIAAETILELKEIKKVKITLECAIPCIGQTDRWNTASKTRYRRVLERADKVTLVSDKSYYTGCFAKRNEFMVNRSDLVVALNFSQSGGTVSTINYALKKDKAIIVIGDNRV